MSGESVKTGILLRKHGYSGVVTVFEGKEHVWSEITPLVRPTMGEALRDAQIRKADLTGKQA